MTIYLSDKLISDIERINDNKYSAKEKSVLQKTIRDYFIRVHNEAVESTVMASNKSVYKSPNFTDEI